MKHNIVSLECKQFIQQILKRDKMFLKNYEYMYINRMPVVAQAQSVTVKMKYLFKFIFLFLSLW